MSNNRIAEGKFLAVLFHWFFLDDPFGYQQSLRKRENFEFSDISINNIIICLSGHNFSYILLYLNSAQAQIDFWFLLSWSFLLAH